MERFTGFLGLAVILGVAWLCSTNRGAIKLRLIAWGLGLQVAFALLVLKTDFGKLFQWIGGGVNAMLEYAEQGSGFLFGPLGVKSGPYGVIFAFQVLPIVIFIASFFVLPLVGNAAEYASALYFARQDRMGLVMTICVGSSIQIALMTAPALVLASYALGHPMDLVFGHPLELMAIAGSAFVVNAIALDGETTWFEGVMLVAVYVLLALAFFFATSP